MENWTISDVLYWVYHIGLNNHSLTIIEREMIEGNRILKFDVSEWEKKWGLSPDEAKKLMERVDEVKKAPKTKKVMERVESL